MDSSFQFQLIFLSSFTCNDVFSVRSGCHILSVLGIGRVNFLRHSLGLPYNNSAVRAQLSHAYRNVDKDERPDQLNFRSNIDVLVLQYQFQSREVDCCLANPGMCIWFESFIRND